MKYEKPTMTLVTFESVDVITLSANDLTAMNYEDILEYESLGIFFE